MKSIVNAVLVCFLISLTGCTSIIPSVSNNSSSEMEKTVAIKTIFMVTTEPAPSEFESWALKLRQPCYGAMSFELLSEDTKKSLIKYEADRIWSSPRSSVSGYHKNEIPKDFKYLNLIITLEYAVELETEVSVDSKDYYFEFYKGKARYGRKDPIAKVGTRIVKVEDSFRVVKLYSDGEIKKKLATTVIPEIDFRGANARDAVGFLARVIEEHDKGMTGGAVSMLPISMDLENPEKVDIPLVTFKAKDLLVVEAMEIIAEYLSLEYRIGDGKVVFSPKKNALMDSNQRSISNNSSVTPDDPFAPDSTQGDK